MTLQPFYEVSFGPDYVCQTHTAGRTIEQFCATADPVWVLRLPGRGIGDAPTKLVRRGRIYYQ